MNILYCDKKSKCGTHKKKPLGNNYCSYGYDAIFFECSCADLVKLSG